MAFKVRGSVRLAAVAVLLALFLHPASSRASSVEAIGRVAQQVHAIRGVAFNAPVEHKVLKRSELRAYLREMMKESLPVPPVDYMRAMRAAQLIDVDPESGVEGILDFYETQALAFYDLRDRVYYSLDSPPAGIEANALMDELVAIHELTHALQDQAFGAGRRMQSLKGKDEAQFAYQAVIEGEATLVMLAEGLSRAGVTLDDALKAGSLGMLRELAASQNKVPKSVPPFITAAATFPYVDGLSFVAAAYARGGWKAVDKLHEQPPVSSEEILHPELYYARTGRGTAKPIAKLDEDQKLVAETEMGEFGWSFLLGREAAAGWSADLLRITEGPGKVMHVAVSSSWDTDRDASDFADAYEAFLHGRKIRARVSRDKRDVFVSYSVTE